MMLTRVIVAADMGATTACRGMLEKRRDARTRSCGEGAIGDRRADAACRRAAAAGNSNTGVAR